jgi:hypothetical protein
MQRIMGSIDSQIPITFLTTVGRCHEVSYDRRVRQRNSLSSISLSSIISYLSIIGAADAQRCRHAHSLGISHSPCFAAVSILRFGRARRKPAASGRRMPQSLWEMLTILRMIASDRIDLSPSEPYFFVSSTGQRRRSVSPRDMRRAANWDEQSIHQILSGPKANHRRSAWNRYLCAGSSIRALLPALGGILQIDKLNWVFVESSGRLLGLDALESCALLRYYASPFQVRSATVQHRQHGGVNGRGKGRGQGL